MCQTSSLGINAKTGIELTLPVELSPLATEGRRRRKLWGIPKRLHCPVIGTCLNVQELRRLASKVDPAGNRTANDYELHVNFVCAAETKNALSYEVHKELERKYAKAVKAFGAAKDEPDILVLWREYLQTGKVAEALWALTTHPRVSNRLYDLVFGEVHMLSHQVGAGQRADLVKLTEQLTELQANLKALQGRHDETLRQTGRRLSEKERKILAMTGQLEEGKALRAKLHRLESQIERLESGEELCRLRFRLEELEPRLEKLHTRHEITLDQLREWRERGQAAVDMAERLKSDLAAVIEERKALEVLLVRDGRPGCENCENKDCPAYPDLGGKHILCVGGRGTLTDARFIESPPLKEDATEVEKMRHFLLILSGRALYAIRKCMVEPVFGIIKAILGFRQFSLRGLENVKGEFNLVAMAWNLKRMFVLAGA